MSGSAGIRLPWHVREAVGLYLAPEGLMLVHLHGTEGHGGAWVAVESCTSEEPAPSDVQQIAVFVRAQLVRAGWEKLPLGLALPTSEAYVEERELPAVLSGAELRAALLWALRAEADEMGRQPSEEIGIVCMAVPNTVPQRYWTAQLSEHRIRAYFSAFAAVDLHLRRLTISPPTANVLAEQIEAAREPRMPWEMSAEEDGYAPAIYAGLLVRADMPEHLYWSTQRSILGRLRFHAALLIAALSSALFLLCVTSDITACMTARQMRDQAMEELSLRASERARMESFSALRSDVMQREEILSAYAAESLPVRALLVHLGSMTADGVRLAGVRAEAHTLRIDGEAVDYAALAAFMGTMEEDPFFSAALVLEEAGEGRSAASAPKHIRFTLRSDW